MAQIKWDGDLIEMAENWRLGEQAEAEDALEIDFVESRSSGRMQVALYISIRRVKPESELARWQLADAVKSMEISEIQQGDADPLPNGAGRNGSEKDSDADALATTGSQPSDTTSP